MGEAVEVASLREPSVLANGMLEDSFPSRRRSLFLETAHQLSNDGTGRPTTLPVRVWYRETFVYPLSCAQS
jgi:hypothetical protein